MLTGVTLKMWQNGLLIVSAVTPIAALRLLPVKALPKKLISGLIYIRVRETGASNLTSKMVVAQSKLETAGYTSNLAKNFNNLFGMRPAQKRKVHYQGIENTVNGEFAAYSSAYNSITDYLALVKSNNMPKDFANTDEFVIWLKSKGYFTETTANYLKAIKSWM